MRESDFAGFPDGAVALMKRGGCRFSDKAAAAQSRGAAAALIANDGLPGHTAPVIGHPFGPGTRIPVLWSRPGSRPSSRRRRGGRPGAGADRSSRSPTTRARAANVIADLPGEKSGVVLLGAHLDSVASGPGINDNGSGSALVLEVARQARRLHLRPSHGLRFAFWGGEELGLLGSTSYVQSLSAKRAAPDSRRSRISTWSARRTSAASSRPEKGSLEAHSGSTRRSTPTSRLAGYPWKRPRSAAPPTTRRSRRPASRSAGYSPAQTRRRRPRRPSASGAGGQLSVRRLLPQGLRHGREYRFRRSRADGRGRRDCGAAPRRLVSSPFRTHWAGWRTNA